MPNNNNILFNSLHHPNIKDGYMISPYGDIKFKDIDESHKPSYHSSNGYDYAIFMTNENKTQLFPIDEIIGMVYIPIPNELIGKKITIKHIDGDTRNISLDNMEWIEDIEIWKVVTYPNVKPNTYEVSNHGRVRNIVTGNIRKNVTDTRYHYEFIGLKTEHGIDKHFFVHRLVAYEFIDASKDLQLDVNHINGIKSNNSEKNLEWVNRRANLIHASNCGLNNIKGENHPGVVLNENCVKLICEKLIEYNGDIEKVVCFINTNTSYDITRWNVERIKYKKIWVYISDKYFTKTDFINVKKHRSGLPVLHEEEVVSICKSLVNNSMNVKDVYKELIGSIPLLTHSQIYKIKKKYTWNHISDRFFT